MATAHAVYFPPGHDGTQRPASQRRLLRIAPMLLLAFALLLWLVSPGHPGPTFGPQKPPSRADEKKSLVPLEIHVMFVASMGLMSQGLVANTEEGRNAQMLETV
jgi:hypothetical protein